MIRPKLPDARGEDGAILIIVAAGMTAFVLIVAFVVDSANWYQHKRHLQLQADAAALAGADSISLPLTSCSDTAITAMAHNYGGRDATNPTALYNSQVGGTPSTRMHILVNSLGYYGDANAGENNGGTPCASAPPNQFCRSASDPNAGGPGIDIKATESNLPWFFGGVVPRINAHAVVCLKQESSSATSLPIAVPNPKPKSAAAIFINEGNSNAVLGTVSLTQCQNPAPPATPTCPTSVSTWTSSGTDITVAAQTGVVIAISGLPSGSLSLSGSLATICGQQLTSCFDATSDPPTVGVNFIRGWSNSTAGIQPNPPQLREVQLFPGSCPGDAYFQAITSGCNVTLEAVVDSRLSTGANPRMGVAVIGAGCKGPNGCALSKDITLPRSAECAAVLAGGATGQCWRGSIPVSAYGGAQRLQMSWNVAEGTITGQGDCTKGNGCNGNFEGGGWVQQAYGADDRPTTNISGPLARVQILGCTSSTNCPVVDANSLPTGTNKVALSVDLKGALQNAQNATDSTAQCVFPDNTVHQFACLKVTVTNAGAGSTQSVNCDPLSSPKKDLDDQLALGCAPQYTLNTGTVCPSSNTLEQSAQPWNCTELFTGNKTPMVSNGLNRRVFGSLGVAGCTTSSCTNPPACPAYGLLGHNNWAMYDPTDQSGRDGFPQDDPRIVGVYLTAYGAFTHTSGTSLTIPITDFGTFYVTGFDGSPCTSAAVTDHPDDPIPDKGTIVGHFIKYVDRLNSGGGTLPCDPSSFGACVPVMTK